MEEKDTSRNQDNPKPDFVAELVPYRSLSRTGFIVLMCFIGATCFVSGMMFLVIGAWPVFLFLGLDVLIIWLAFKLNYRAARRKERISVSRDELRIQVYDPSGREVAHVFNPFWTRLEIDRHEELGITRMVVASSDRRLQIGAFLNPDDRESFAVAFQRALGSAKS